MTYLWDTTTFSALMRRDAKVRARLAVLTAADRVVICMITRGEVLYGLARLPAGKRRSALEAEAMSLFGQLVCWRSPKPLPISMPQSNGKPSGRAPRSMRMISGLRRQRAPWKPLWSRQTVISSGSAVFRQRIGPNEMDWAGPRSRSASKTWDTMELVRRETEAPVVWQAGGLSLSPCVMLSIFWGAKPYEFFDHTLYFAAIVAFARLRPPPEAFGEVYRR